MAGGLPPPPTRADTGDFAWVAWYNQLYTLLSTTGAVSWDQINKAGSSIADLQNHNHGLLTSILGTGQYHVSSAEASKLTALTTTGHNALTGINGTGTYHVSSTEAGTLTALNTTGHNALTGIDGSGTYHVTSTQASNLNSGVSGTFKSGDIPQKTITVTNGIITSIV